MTGLMYGCAFILEDDAHQMQSEDVWAGKCIQQLLLAAFTL